MGKQKTKNTRRQRAALEEQRQQVLRDEERQQAERGAPGRSRLKATIRGTVIFVLGALASPFIVQELAELVPGPKVGVAVNGVRSKEDGCISHLIIVSNDEPVDFLYLKIQFFSTITDYKVGIPFQSLDSFREGRAVDETGKSANGKCVVIQTTEVESSDVTASANRNIVTIRDSKVARKSPVIGIVVTAADDPRQQNAIQYAEGEYEYTKFGQLVRKPLSFTDGKMHDGP